MWPPPWWLASLGANLAIAVVEYLNRTAGFASFSRAVMVTGPIIVVAQCGLFYAWRDAPSMMFAWAFFTVGNSLVRLASVHFLIGGEALSWHVLGGTSLMFLGALWVKGG